VFDENVSRGGESVHLRLGLPTSISESALHQCHQGSIRVSRSSERHFRGQSSSQDDRVAIRLVPNFIACVQRGRIRIVLLEHLERGFRVCYICPQLKATSYGGCVSLLRINSNR
jgi:hypothetical protein